MRCKLCTPSKTFERRGKNFMDQRGRSGYQVKCRKMSLWTKSYNNNSSFPLSLLAQSYGGQENIWTKFHNFFWYMVWHGIMGIKGRDSTTTMLWYESSIHYMHEENMRIWKLQNQWQSWECLFKRSYIMQYVSRWKYGLEKSYTLHRRCLVLIQ